MPDATTTTPPPTQPVGQTTEELKVIPSIIPDMGIWGEIVDRVRGFVKTVGIKVPGVPDSAEPGTIGQLAIDANTPVADIIAMLSDATGDTEAIINDLDEEKDHPVGAIFLQLAIVVGYGAPAVLSFLMGMAIGEQYSKGLELFQFYAVYAACLVYEFMLVMLMFAMVRQTLRAMVTDSLQASMRAWLSVALLFLVYVVIAVSSAAAQWIFYEAKINLADHFSLAGAAIRTFAIPVIDLVCAIALPILYRKSIDKKLNEMQKKTDAIVRINKQKIASRIALINEAIVTKSTLQKEADYQSKNELANTLIKLISDKIIKDAQNSLNIDPASAAAGSRRDTRR
jgi:hypothetical protein